MPSGIILRRTTNTRAWTLIELLIVLAILCLLAAMLIPAFTRPGSRHMQGIVCKNNLRIMLFAFQNWATDNHGLYPMQVSVTNGGTLEWVGGSPVSRHFQVMSNELSTPRSLYCPEDTQRNYATNFNLGFSDQNLSYFLNTSATTNSPAAVLSGDRNITNQPTPGNRLVPLTPAGSIAWTKELHRNQGHLLFVDGRVEFLKNGSVPANLGTSSVATNLLAVP